MQGQDTQKSNNVVSLFARKKSEGADECAAGDACEKSADGSTPEGKKETFQEVMDRNAKNKERLEKERSSANKGVLRSYRIKH